MLGGLDWTGTALGRAFKSQEQVLFLFASFIFIISITLHLFSIPEQPFTPGNQIRAAESGESSSNLSLTGGHMANLLDAVVEEDISAPVAPKEGESGPRGEADFLAVDRLRSKSDSVLAMPDSTVELDPDLDPGMQHFRPDVHHFLPDTGAELEDVFKASHSGSGLSSPSGRPAVTDQDLVPERSELNGPKSPRPSGSRDSPQVRSAAPNESERVGWVFFKAPSSLPAGHSGQRCQCWFVSWSLQCGESSPLHPGHKPPVKHLRFTTATSSHLLQTGSLPFLIPSSQMAQTCRFLKGVFSCLSPALVHVLLLWSRGVPALSAAEDGAVAPAAGGHVPQSE